MVGNGVVKRLARHNLGAHPSALLPTRRGRLERRGPLKSVPSGSANFDQKKCISRFGARSRGEAMGRATIFLLVTLPVAVQAFSHMARAGRSVSLLMNLLPPRNERILISPSVAKADFLNLGADLRAAIDGGADWLHFSIQGACTRVLAALTGRSRALLARHLSPPRDNPPGVRASP